jgi:hypothetical protein
MDRAGRTAKLRRDDGDQRWMHRFGSMRLRKDDGAYHGRHVIRLQWRSRSKKRRQQDCGIHADCLLASRGALAVSKHRLEVARLGRDFAAILESDAYLTSGTVRDEHRVISRL